MRNIFLLAVALLLSATATAQTKERVWNTGNDFLAICAVEVVGEIYCTLEAIAEGEEPQEFTYYRQ